MPGGETVGTKQRGAVLVRAEHNLGLESDVPGRKVGACMGPLAARPQVLDVLNLPQRSKRSGAWVVR